ncbi:SusD/RagB family nutrient-binding outer membrane lipoprotein [Siphonobacter sp. BAB-5405]|uniref:SusD/RagB family nutrient-binding outer membrane lipoprotein n=1 Tax=Siphonobacter sp. BAB-5405 TaxID=1864825 RepID=UPI000C805A87|nr:SusD/RagB family nutrient-binding outer membrane lipoprotein [Siphonobacter sp. BAB-5405]PMD99385.1 SusD/RagB family nutrient-binding outer membrane lipoprotein [Siphonobacter sp. BAB-5405]
MLKYIKNKTVLMSALAATVLLTSCDNGFEELNTDPNALPNAELPYMFAYSVVRTSGTGYENHRANLIYAGAMVQHFASLETYWSGDKYLYNSAYSDAYFETAYKNHAKELEEIIANTRNNPEQSNLYNIARIWKVVVYHRITDLYGDIPYTEAAKGYLEYIYAPKYDRQQDIYNDMLNELEQAALGLDANKSTFGANDIVFGGNVTKWKKFAYSMMLRLGMRLTKADPAKAETYVKKAIAGGVMTSNEDIAKVAHAEGNDNTRNLDSNTLRTQEYVNNLRGKSNSKLSKTFVDFLKNNNDPRMPFIATLWQGNQDPTQEATATNPARQKGLPNGFDATTIRSSVSGWGTTDSLPLYSEANLNRIASNSAPTVFQTYAEVEYLLAEASVRGWGSGTAADHYNKGVTAAMEMMSLYGGTVTPAQITAYLAAHPYQTGTTAQQMEQIATQYWAVNFLNSYEAYANWRRTDFPVLTPTNYTGNATGGVIPRRLRYPTTEASKNATNYNEAVARQGADLLTTRVWWDKQ